MENEKVVGRGGKAQMAVKREQSQNAGVVKEGLGLETEAGNDEARRAES